MGEGGEAEVVEIDGMGGLCSRQGGSFAIVQ